MNHLLALISGLCKLLKTAAYATPLPHIQVSTVGEEMLYNPRLTKDEVILWPICHFLD